MRVPLTARFAGGTLGSMNSKPTVEQFMQDCFRERTEALTRRLEIHRVYWRRFYRDGCLYDSRRGVIEASEGEKMVSVTPTDVGACVVSTGKSIYRSRYQISLAGEKWLIQEVDMECGRCRGLENSAQCPGCGGSGWLSWQDSLRGLRSNCRKISAEVMTKEELGDRSYRDAGVERFMTEHFRERTISRGKELEIEADYVRRFYRPDFDGARWVPSQEASEAETLLGVEGADMGVRVITSGAHGKRLRYHLRPVGQSWLIWDVDVECIFCSQEGPNPNCFWCGGTVWERRPDSGRNRTCSTHNKSPRGNSRRWFR